MNIIFISATCARADYEEICKNRKAPMLDSSQKFFEMFLNGMSRIDGVSVDAISVRPLSRGTYPGFHIKKKQTDCHGVCYHYTPIWNFPILKSLFAVRDVKRLLKKLLKQYDSENTKIICDPLLLEGLLPAVRCGKKFGVETIGFLTDMPDFADECDNHGKLKALLYRLYNKQAKQSLRALDKHIVLTEAMNVVAEGKPWHLLDCIVDTTMLDGLLPAEHSDNRPHILYAGKLHREFGLDLLGEAMKLVQADCVFDIYGYGNYVDELRKIANENGNIHLHGIKPLKEILRAELSAALLVNPRTSAGEFTKYSFPSKTSEYMLSGVPTVMFRLPGISAEYEDYLFYAQEETPASLAAKIDEVLSMSQEQREKFGARAKAFITENKNNIKQAQAVLSFAQKK